MTKELSPLRSKDIETGRKAEREAIITWLRKHGYRQVAMMVEEGEHLK